MKLADIVDQQYREFLRGERFPFPRDLAFPWRVKVVSLEDYIKTIHRMRERESVYVSLYSDVSIERETYHRMLADFDTNPHRPTLEDVWRDARKFSSKLREKYEAEPQHIYTGGGFHVLIDFPETALHFPKAMREFAAVVATEAGVSMPDASVLGDCRRVTRLPFTLNQKEKYDPKPLCIPVRPEWTLAKIIRESHYCSYECLLERNECLRVADELLKYDQMLFHEYSRRQKFKPNAKSTNDGRWKRELDIISRLAERIAELGRKDFDGRHRILHFCAIPILVQLGASDEEIEGWVRDWIIKTGESWTERRRSVVQASIKRTRAGPKGDYSESWSPWTLETFFQKYPELMEYFTRDYLGGKIEG